jgi:hypothetical protein
LEESAGNIVVNVHYHGKMDADRISGNDEIPEAGETEPTACPPTGR